MLYRHEDKTLQGIEDDPDFTGGYSKEVVKAFLKVLRLIVRAENENDLRAVKGLHFEKLKGKRKYEYSMRINDQFRLIFQIESTDEGNRLVLTGIEDYH